MRRWMHGAALGLSLALVVTACGGDTTTSSETEPTEAAGDEQTTASSEPATSTPDPSGETASMTAGTFPGALLYASTDLALAQGLYEEQGLELSTVNPQDGATMMRLLINNQDMNVVMADATAAISAAASGQDVVIVGSVINKSLFQLSATNELLGEVDGDWETKTRALEGRTIGVPGIGGGADLTVRGLLREAGLDPENDVTFVSITSISAAVAQLEQGEIDAYVYIAPGADAIEDAGAGGLYLDIAAEAPSNISDAVIGMLTTQGFVDANPEAVDRWLAGEEAAIDYMTDPDNREDVVSFLAENYANGDEEAAGELLDYLSETLYSTSETGLSVPQDALQNQIDLLTNGGMIEEGAVSVDDLLAER